MSVRHPMLSSLMTRHPQLPETWSVCSPHLGGGKEAICYTLYMSHGVYFWQPPCMRITLTKPQKNPAHVCPTSNTMRTVSHPARLRQALILLRLLLMFLLQLLSSWLHEVLDVDGSPPTALGLLLCGSHGWISMRNENDQFATLPLP